MSEKPTEHQTMYIKFPTVTKLQYPNEPVNDHSNSHRSIISFRQNFIRTERLKVDYLGTESFKIINLPQKSDIMNICMMTVHNKEKDEEHNSGTNDKFIRKKIFSIQKLNTLRIKGEKQPAYINPFKVRSSSISELKKNTHVQPLHVNYFQVYPQISKLIALSFGCAVLNQGASKIRRAKIETNNNPILIKHTIKKRAWWTVVDELKQFDEDNSKINFIWSAQILNKKTTQKFIQNNQICMKQMCEDHKLKPIFQRSFDKILNQLPKIKQLLFTQWDIQPPKLKNWLNDLINQPKLRLIYPDDLTFNNHLPNNLEITNKKLLYKNMVTYYNWMNIDPYCKIPKTYHITSFNWQDIVRELKNEERIWILKPGENTNRGKGISVFKSTKEALFEILNNPPKNEERTFLLQEYITPMLYEDRKFDIRCYMLGVEIGQHLKFYWYEEGYIRTASQKFSLKKVSKSIHLTNDAIQKNMPNYDKYESANKLSYSQMDKYFSNHTTHKFCQEILPQIKKITRDICCAVGDKRLIGAGKGLSMEIFGLDYLVDEFGKPWLCEVNTNPSFQICCSLLSRIIPQLLQNTFRLVNDIILPSSKKIPEYAQSFITNNKYSLIYSNRLQQLQ